MGDPRIHAAIVCASKGCPILLNEAYVPKRLSEQLDRSTRKWLEDPQRGMKQRGDTVWLSKIFDWFGSDFGKTEAESKASCGRFWPNPGTRRPAFTIEIFSQFFKTTEIQPARGAGPAPTPPRESFVKQSCVTIRSKDY